jgi:phosphatidylethanolamine/phosphatidyl-N-methylethanolamine N-methyltransferase
MAINTTSWNRIRYSVYAPFYNIITLLFRRSRKQAIEMLNLQSNERVLIVGAGTGLDLDFLPTDVHITAIDLAPVMVKRSKRRAEKLGLSSDIRVMNAEKLSFGSGQFDCAIMHLILAVIPDPVACASEVARVLKPGGRVSIFDKFLKDDASPATFRRTLNFITNTLFSDINRQLGPILHEAGLEPIHQEPSFLKGTFHITIAEKK